MGLPARRPGSAVLDVAVTAAPEEVVERFTSRGDIERDPHSGHGGDHDYAIERTADGFTLTSDPGAWRPGTRAICEVHLAPIEGGAQVHIRFRLHPLTRTAFAYIIALGLVMTVFQYVVAGPTIAATMLVPFLVIVGLLAADRTGLRRQQRALRTVVEATLAPITMPQERALAGPFRRGPASDP